MQLAPFTPPISVYFHKLLTLIAVIKSRSSRKDVHLNVKTNEYESNLRQSYAPFKVPHTAIAIFNSIIDIMKHICTHIMHPTKRLHADPRQDDLTRCDDEDEQ